MEEWPGEEEEKVGEVSGKCLQHILFSSSGGATPDQRTLGEHRHKNLI